MKNILDALENSSKQFGDKIVFEENDKSITYDEFVKQAKILASSFSAENIKNRPIAVFDNRNIKTLIGMFAVLYSGNYYVVIDSHSPEERIQKIYDTINPIFTILENENKDLFSNLKTDSEIVEFDENAVIKEELLSKIRANQISTDPAYALFTSGSTGMPKGTIVSHQNVINYIEWFTSEFEISNDTVFGSQTPFYFSMSVSDIFGTIFSGASFVIIPKTYFSFPIKLVEILNQKKINTIYWVPSALCIVANIKLFDYAKPEQLKYVLFAGEVMPNKQLNYWRKNLQNVKFANLFGPTETTDICTFYKIDRQFADDEALPIGKHCNNLETFIIDDNGKEIVEKDKVGELFVRGSFVAFGYYDNLEKTNSAFVQNPLHNHYREIVYKTGDLVKINNYGEYEYVGRKDFQIKHMGYRIELGEIETNAGAIDGVNSVCCVYNSIKDLIIMIYEGKIKQENLFEEIKKKVPPYMVPNEIIKISMMPHNQNGKIDRAYLKNNYDTLRR